LATSSKSVRRLKVHVVQAKLGVDAISELFSVIDGHVNSEDLALERCSNPVVADVVITAVRMRKRLE
jgi:DNA polymerase IV